MTDRTLPHACAVSNRAVTELLMHGENALAKELAGINRATCDLVHALHAAHEATTADALLSARNQASDAIARLRGTAAQGTDAAARALTLGQLPHSFNAKPYATT